MIKKKKMNIFEARKYINDLAGEYLTLGENATETEFREKFSKLDKERDKWQWMSPGIYGSVIAITAYFTGKYSQPSDVTDFLGKYYPDYARDCEYDYQNKALIHEKWAEAFIKLDVESSAYSHLKEAAFFQLIDNVSYDGFEYFSFRGFSDYAMADIRNNTITLSHPSTFNDPMDTILLRWNDYLLKSAADETERKLRMLYQKVYDHIKVRCFVRTERLPRNEAPEQLQSINKVQRIEDVNPLMWAHYADCHKGFCVKYKLSGQLVRNEDKDTLTWSRIGNIDYRGSMIFPTQNNSLWDALFAKHDVWEYEKEVRLIHYDPDDGSNYKTLEIPEDSIQAIYLGLKCTDENKEKMKLLLRNRNIKLYQMKVDDIDSYKLVKERIL